jgi:hypothetical protein
MLLVRDIPAMMMFLTLSVQKDCGESLSEIMKRKVEAKAGYQVNRYMVTGLFARTEQFEQWSANCTG